MLLIMFIVLLIIFYAVYEYMDKDIFAPSSALISGYILTTIFAIYNVERWRSDISILAILIIMLGIISFIIHCLISKKVVYSKEKYKERYNMNVVLDSISANGGKTKLIIAILICILYY